MRAYLKRLAERLSAQPGAQVTDMPVQRMDRQMYGSGNGNGAIVDTQLQVGCCAGHAHTTVSPGSLLSSPFRVSSFVFRVQSFGKTASWPGVQRPGIDYGKSLLTQLMFRR